MLGDWRIDQPRTLFTLPHPVDPVSGNIKLGRVWGFQGSRKRRRTEIVVAADGECVNVYSIKSPALLVTHALPPQTFLTSAPACVYRQAGKKRHTQRFTYAATQSDLGASRKELLCFQEELAAPTKSNSQATNAPLKWTWDITSLDTEIVHIEPLPGTRGADGLDFHDILLVFANGEVIILPENLQAGKLESTYGNHRPVSAVEPDHDSSLHVEFIAVHTVPGARRSLLRGRPDLAASLDEDSIVLLLVTSTRNTESSQREQYMLRIWSVTRLHGDQLARPTIRPLMSWCLPRTRNATDVTYTTPSTAQFAYDHTSSSLYQLDEGIVSMCKLSFTTPQITARFRTVRGNVNCLLPISESTILASSAGHCALYDSRYGSLLADQTMNTLTVPDDSSRKRKRSKSQDRDSSVAISFKFSSLGVVVGLVGYDLVSLWVSALSRTRTQRVQSQLINSLGKTRIAPTAARLTLGLNPRRALRMASNTTNSFDESWNAMLSKLMGLPNTQKAESFDTFFINILRSFEQRNRTGTDPFGRDLALKIISAIFARRRPAGSMSAPLDMPNSPSIVFEFLPRTALEWLLKSGHLTAQNMEKALFVLGGGGCAAADPLTTVTETDVVAAIAEADPQLHFLSLLVTSRRLGLSGSVASFKLLMSSFDSPELHQPNGLLEMDDPKVRSTDIKETDDEFLVEENAAAHELQVATSMLEENFDERGSALKTCLERLGTCFSLPELVQALRHQLSQREIMMLVELLRIELEQAGWTSRRLDFHPSHDATESQNEAISVICKLINCALDAMGTVGWLAEEELNAAEDVSSLISLLRAETSAALEGVQEATFFCGFLKDFIRFEAALGDSSFSSGRRSAVSLSEKMRSGMLPFGVNVAQKVSTTRIGAGGELQKRSARRIGLELSQRVGKYRFETIRV